MLTCKDSSEEWWAIPGWVDCTSPRSVYSGPPSYGAGQRSHNGPEQGLLFHLQRTVFSAFDQGVGSISLFLQYNKLDYWPWKKWSRKFIFTGIVIRFEQFLFEFVFVLETSQTIHGLKVDKINLRPDLVRKDTEFRK